VIVVDASALLEALLRTSSAKAVEDRLLALSQTGARGGLALGDLADLPLRRYPYDFLLPRIWELRNNLTAQDGAYVALAEALDASLLTRDRRLAQPPAIARRSNWCNPTQSSVWSAHPASPSSDPR
jgi:predicted nucleic acid-binding protein